MSLPDRLKMGGQDSKTIPLLIKEELIDFQVISNDTSNANKNILFTTGGGNQQSMMNNE